MPFASFLEFVASDLTIAPFEDEFKTMYQLLAGPGCERRNKLAEDYLASQENLTTIDGDNTKSKKFRADGNREFKSRNLVKAIAAYTSAIFAAQNGTEELALAHANRAVALQAYGLYYEAYDDCRCALDAGYPEKMRVKIKIRQAHCALKMQDREKVQEHLSDLANLQLNENFKKELDLVSNGLKNMSLRDKNQEDDSSEASETCNKTYIAAVPGRGRGLLAKEAIRKYDFLYADRAIAFVPLPQAEICQECAAMQIIPFPCYNCYSAVYCSRRCKRAHQRIHSYECAGSKTGLFKQIGLCYLALRTTLTLMCKIPELLGHIEDVTAIWKELVPPLKILKDDKDVSPTLNLITHLKTMSADSLAITSCGIQVLTVYLRQCPDFVKLFYKTKAGYKQWELITASLMLRVFGQQAVNASTVETLSAVSASTTLLDGSLWCSPYHLNRGRLHAFGNIQVSHAALFPYMSICNHSCDISYAARYSGSHLTTFAIADLAKDEEIFNNFAPHLQNHPIKTRQSYLKNNYNFVCQCLRCSSGSGGFNQRQRCFYRDCNEVFESYEYADSSGSDLKNGACTFCKRGQPNNSIREVQRKCETICGSSSRKNLFKSFQSLDEYYLGNHSSKAFVARRISLVCLQAHLDGDYMSSEEFQQLEKITSCALDYMEQSRGLASIEYIALMTVMWDIYALGKLPISQGKIDRMLKISLLVLPDELKDIFVNYFNDYLKGLIVKQ